MTQDLVYGHYTLSGPNQPDSLFRTGSDSRLTRRWVVSDLPTRRLGDLIGLLSSIHLYLPYRHTGHERAWRANTRRDELLRDLDLLDSDYRTEPGVLEYLTSMVLVYSGR